MWHTQNIIEIKPKNKLYCNYDGQWWDDTCGDLIGFGTNQ
jgi:hypothetical protein